MREILFRGKRLDNGEWVYGDLEYSRIVETAFIHTYHADTKGYAGQCRVDPATIGQYTGLTDKHGNKIFEGDVIAINGKGFGYVMWNYNGYFFLNNHFDECMRDMETIGDFLEIRYVQTNGEIDYRIIGNIHDHPELMKGDY